MSRFRNTAFGKVASITVSLTTALTLSGATAVMPSVAAAQTVEELQAQISALLAQISALQAQLAGLTGAPAGAACGFTFSTDLSQGDTGTDVLNLQKALNNDSATQLASSGAGSPGNETSFFGPITRSAVVKFQEKYASEVLTPIGLSAGTGYVGSMTRAKLNALYGTCPTDGDGAPAPTPGTGLSVSAPAQPAASLAVQSAARIPFTKVTFTAGTDGDVTIDGVTVERTGLANDAVFAGVVLLDENGIQLGIAKTLNSVHQTTVGESFVVPAGQSRTMTIAGNMAGTLTAYAGQVAYLSVVGVSTSATVSGTLPVTGAGHTVNATLSIGTVQASRGPLDPATNPEKEVGTTGYTFASVKITAGSAEKVRLHSVRWNQSGSVAPSDLANVTVSVDGTVYTPTVSSDSKYYTATFGSGVVIDKGLFAEVSIKGDIVSGSGRTINFDIYKTTDVYVTGETFGYGITPTIGANQDSNSSTDDSEFNASGTPWYDGSKVTISGGSINVSKATEVASQNVAVNVSNQPLGGVKVKVDGEPISVQQIVFDVATTTGTWTGLLTSVTLSDANGAVVAGPVDTTGAGTTITFTDTVTFPVGENVYTVKGKLPSTTANNGTYQLTTNPATDWTTVTGQDTGNSITPAPSGDQALQTMTAKAGAVAISVSGTPAAQNVVAGTQDFLFANIQFDTTASGEDVKFVSLLGSFTNGGTATYITGCQMFDGASALNTGSNVIDSVSAGSNTFTLDSPLTIAKGTVKTIGLKCDISSSATSSSYFKWGIPAASGFSATGLTSGQTITPTGSANAGPQMTIATGALAVTKDASSPSYALVAAGTSGVNLGVLRFTSTNEAIDLQQVALQLTNTASSSASDLTSVSLWDGATNVGSGIFAGTGTTTLITLSPTVNVAKDSYKLLTIKGDSADITVANASTHEGSFVAVDWDSDAQAGATKGIGSSGTTITATGSDTSTSGVRVFKSYPTIAKLAVPETTLRTGTMDLYRFSLATSPASANGIGLYQLTVNIATSSASAVSGTTTVTNLKVYAYTDSAFSTPVSGYTSGQIVATVAGLVSGDNDAQLSSILQIPAGSTYYFRVVGDTTLTAGTGTFSGSVSTKLSGDTAYVTGINTRMGTATAVDGITDNDFIWSPNATTTSAAAHVDWTNGYGVSGLPADGTDTVTISK